MSAGLAVILSFAAHLMLQVTLTIRAIMRPNREPVARMAWVVVIFAVPIIGMVTYLLFGETKLGRKRVERATAARDRLAPIMRLWQQSDPPAVDIPTRHAMLFAAGRAVSGFPPVGGNAAALLQDNAATIEAMVADIDAARDHVHVLFYIWLGDASGRAVAVALMRAAGRGVTCRAMADDIGSRQLIRSPLWTEMAAAGVRTSRALPVGNPVMRVIEGRLDMRNHRKIVVIDNRITYCGSQNCADAAFAIKAKFAPWVDIMVRFEGPVALQNQLLFALDWMSHTDEDLHDLFAEAAHTPPGAGVTAQVVASDPGSRYSAMPEMFESLMYAAREELVITTPYYVPDESMQAALCACARRGVATMLVLPARNDSLIVAAASRSYYRQLLDAGVVLQEFEGGLLHAKTLTLDGEIVLVGSANIDRRSFDLNSENNVLAFDAGLTGAVRARQQSWIAASRRVTKDEVAAWTGRRKLWNNAVAMVGPLL